MGGGENVLFIGDVLNGRSPSFRSLKTVLSGSLALGPPLIGVHCKKRYASVQIQYPDFDPS